MEMFYITLHVNLTIGDKMKFQDSISLYKVNILYLFPKLVFYHTTYMCNF